MKDHGVIVSIGDTATIQLLGRPGNGFRGCLIRQGMHLPGLADIPALAELAAQITTRSAKREHRCAGQKVIQGLFLDGIDTEATGATIGVEDHGTFVILPNETETLFTLLDVTITGAKIALNTPILKFVPVFCGEMSGFHES